MRRNDRISTTARPANISSNTTTTMIPVNSPGIIDPDAFPGDGAAAAEGGADAFVDAPLAAAANSAAVGTPNPFGLFNNGFVSGYWVGSTRNRCDSDAGP